ncbi:MAG: hypothetical protein KatS3mg082_0501 [Nitrospiraceae bacterium]|nr:MAG: hypothetical protein KatS3mg082_0501 [Nitrospiraceae bacterium]
MFELLSVYGAGVYTVDTPICSAGVHAGKITRAKGGMLTIKLLPGQSVYPGSTNKGITSFTAEARPQSYTFVPTPPHIPLPPGAPTPLLPPPD